MAMAIWVPPCLYLLLWTWQLIHIYSWNMLHVFVFQSQITCLQVRLLALWKLSFGLRFIVGSDPLSVWHHLPPLIFPILLLDNLESWGLRSNYYLVYLLRPFFYNVDGNTDRAPYRSPKNWVHAMILYKRRWFFKSDLGLSNPQTTQAYCLFSPLLKLTPCLYQLALKSPCIRINLRLL